MSIKPDNPEKNISNIVPWDLPGFKPYSAPCAHAIPGKDDRPETGLQGQITEEELAAGATEKAFTCNTTLIGQYQGQGADANGLCWFGNYAYMQTTFSNDAKHPGIAVLDCSDPGNPTPVAYLDSDAATRGVDSTCVNETRKILAVVGAYTHSEEPGLINGSNCPLSLYDISDPGKPVLAGEVENLEGVLSYSANMTPDGNTLYCCPGTENGIWVIDISDLSNPKILGSFPEDERGYDFVFSDDGNICYMTRMGYEPIDFYPDCADEGGIIIWDVSDFQNRVEHPKARKLGHLFWTETGGTHAYKHTVKIKGRTCIITADEMGNSYAKEKPEVTTDFGFVRIIDVSNPEKPVVITKIMLDINSPQAGIAPEYAGSSHHMGVNSLEDPTLLAVSWKECGLRVFDISNILCPREVAYYKAPYIPNPVSPKAKFFLKNPNLPQAQMFMSINTDIHYSEVRFTEHDGKIQLWCASSLNGFMIIGLTKTEKELLSAGF